MKNLIRSATYAICLITLLQQRSNAQLVYIPDPNFRAWLNNVPTLIDANGFMDINNPVIATLNYASIQVNWDPADLTGLEYLTGLTTLFLEFDTNVVVL